MLENLQVEAQLAQTGYLTDKGLIPMPNDEYKEFSAAGKKLIPLKSL